MTPESLWRLSLERLLSVYALWLISASIEQWKTLQGVFEALTASLKAASPGQNGSASFG